MPNQNPMILFSQKRAGPLAANVIALWPSADSWNDFGHRVRFHVEFNVEGASKHGVEIQLAFVGETESPVKVVERMFRNRTGFLPASEFPTFFTLLPSLEAYREFVVFFGSMASSLLLQLNDLVALGRTKKPDWYPSVLKLETFTHGLIRSNEAFFAFHNAADILDGVDSEGTSGLSEHFHIKRQLPNFSAPHELQLDFTNDEVAPRRIAVLIGENGAGKTQLLAAIARSIVKGLDDIVDPSLPEQRTLVSRLIVLEAPRIDKSPFPRRTRGSRSFYRRRSLYRNDGTAIGDTIVQLARSMSYVAGMRRDALFLKMIEPIGDPSTIVLRSNTKPEAWSLRDLSRAPYSESSKLSMYADVEGQNDAWWRNDGNQLVPLSSGQAALLRFAAQLCLLVERGTLLLIDEPETHLHPAFIRQLVSILDELLASTGSAA